MVVSHQGGGMMMMVTAVVSHQGGMMMMVMMVLGLGPPYPSKSTPHGYPSASQGTGHHPRECYGKCVYALQHGKASQAHGEHETQHVSWYDPWLGDDMLMD